MNTPPWLRHLTEKLGPLRQALEPLLQEARHLASPSRAPRPAPPPAAEAPPPDQVADRLHHLQHEFERSTVRLGIIGESGSGKSSLINAIVGRPVAPVGALIETTQRPQEVPVDGLILVDLPGCGTPSWPRDTYLQRLHLLDDYDGFILVTAHRLKECDAHLYNELAHKARKPCFVVRSHFDLAAAARGEREARDIITVHIRQQLRIGADVPIYMVCSINEEHYDLEKLILDVREALPDWKRVRFTLAAHAYGAQTLAKKREAAEKLVGIYAGLAAANALNPIPGLDISVDLGLMTTMSRYVISAYGLTQPQVDALKGQVTKRAAVWRGLQEVADRMTPYLTEKFIVATLRRMGMEVLVRNSSKWVPFVGTLISAGVGYKMTYSFGERLINDCEAAAKQVIAYLEPSKAVEADPVGP